ncbi:DUF11 domain-containing protein [Rhodobacteraceae bacterium]|nr:DUF11 domain-containing protein [Paracoccaceae bacterium]
MKKWLLLAFAMLFGNGVAAQTLTVGDFEVYINDLTGFVGSGTAVVSENPDATGLNYGLGVSVSSTYATSLGGGAFVVSGTSTALTPTDGTDDGTTTLTDSSPVNALGYSIVDLFDHGSSGTFSDVLTFSANGTPLFTLSDGFLLGSGDTGLVDVRLMDDTLVTQITQGQATATFIGVINTSGTISNLGVSYDYSQLGPGFGEDLHGIDQIVEVVLPPEIDVAKSASVGPLQNDGTFDVTYTVVTTNVGAVSISNLTLEDALDAGDQLGTAFNGVLPTPSLSSGPTDGASTGIAVNTNYDGEGGSDPSLIAAGGVLAAGDSFAVQFTVNVDPDAAGAPGTLDNTATASGVGPNSAVVTDDSDTDTAPDGTADGTPNVPNGPGDPTVVTPPPVVAGTIGLVKTSVLNDDDGTAGVSAGDSIAYTYVVTNTSTAVNIFNVTVTEPNTVANDFTGTGTVPVPLHDTSTGSNLDGGAGTATDIAPGDTVTFRASYTITQADIDAGGVTNSALASGTDPAGNIPTDVSDESDPADSNDDPTFTPLLSAGISVVKSADTSALSTPLAVGDVLNFTYQVSNAGNVALAPAPSLIASDTINLGADGSGSAVALNAAPSFAGGPAAGDLDGDNVLDLDETWTYTASFTLTQAAIDAGGVQNTATASGNPVDGAGVDIPGEVDPTDISDNDDTGNGTSGIDDAPGGTGDTTGDDNPTNVTLAAVADPGLVVTKAIAGNTGTVVLGDAVAYTITAQNPDLISAVGSINLVDVLPIGLTFIPGTATVDGAPITPVLSGQSIIFSGQNLPAATTLTYTLSVRVGPNAPTGDLINTVSLRDPATNALLSNVASATVFRRYEAVFDCSDIIGKVFDDLNMDGYQNDPNVRTGELTDQASPFRGKVASDQFDLTEERGLANVRLVTPTGTIITTDEYGRYSVPCAELPTRSGTNFSLKLDTRSLPTGYRVTTENPRTLRVTPGIVTEMNFGAALGRVVDIDLSAQAFSGAVPIQRLVGGIERLLQRVERTPAVLRLAYFKRGEADGLVRNRLDAVEDLIRERWRGSGRYRLIIERSTVVIQ